MHPLPVVVELDVFENVLLRLLPRFVALAVHWLALERLEEGFRERVVPWVARLRHGLGDSMGLEAALERPGSVLGTLVIVENDAREADKARLALGPSARKEWGRRCLLPIGVILRILDWTAMRGGYGVRIV